MSDYWHDRALPVLRALNEPTDAAFGQTRILTLGRNGGQRTLGLSLPDGGVFDTILQLRDAGYVEYEETSFFHPGGVHVIGLKVSGRGMQVLGEWPHFELLISPITFAALLEALSDYAPAEEAAAIKRSAVVVKGMSAAALKAVLMGAGSQLARHALGLP